MGESGHAISSWSASTGYLASMLTRGAKADLASTRQLLAPSVNISADIQHYLQYLLKNCCISSHNPVQICSGIRRGRVLKGELYAHRVQKIIYLYLFTELFLENLSAGSRFV